MGAHSGLRHGDVDQELLLRNEYLAAENRILKAKLKGRVRLSDAERARLGEIGHRLGRKVLGEVATSPHHQVPHRTVGILPRAEPDKPANCDNDHSARAGGRRIIRSSRCD